jgi:hypothetical protein
VDNIRRVVNHSPTKLIRPSHPVVINQEQHYRGAAEGSLDLKAPSIERCLPSDVMKRTIKNGIQNDHRVVSQESQQ